MLGITFAAVFLLRAIGQHDWWTQYYPNVSSARVCVCVCVCARVLRAVCVHARAQAGALPPPGAWRPALRGLAPAAAR